MPLEFEWDDKKEASNIKKHGCSFDEAITVFNDPLSLIFDDEKHSDEEEREIIIGHSILRRLLLISFTERGRDLIRIISCRKATKHERKQYEENAS